ncbi:MAG: hypothetical protein RMJ53_03500 [Chitinophagales bacterium]|nr:hypothetical protein [Chitinophagales bacterium]
MDVFFSVAFLAEDVLEVAAFVFDVAFTLFLEVTALFLEADADLVFLAGAAFFALFAFDGVAFLLVALAVSFVFDVLALLLLVFFTAEAFFADFLSVFFAEALFLFAFFFSLAISRNLDARLRKFFITKIIVIGKYLCCEYK